MTADKHILSDTKQAECQIKYRLLQLFLAFRIASIEHHCRAAEPLPFIADDLLVHFDDARSEATLELLAGLGASTQVLLFTHHGRIAEAAQTLAQRGAAVVIDMACD